MAITKGVIGWTIRFTLKRNGVSVGDITGAEELNIHLLKPPNHTEEDIYPLEPWGDGLSSQVYFTTTARDQIDKAGRWRGVGYVKMDGYDGATDPIEFDVIDPGITLPAP